jgi:hypothetical protein
MNVFSLQTERERKHGPDIFKRGSVFLGKNNRSGTRNVDLFSANDCKVHTESSHVRDKGIEPLMPDRESGGLPLT